MHSNPIKHHPQPSVAVSGPAHAHANICIYFEVDVHTKAGVHGNSEIPTPICPNMPTMAKTVVALLLPVLVLFFPLLLWVPSKGKLPAKRVMLARGMIHPPYCSNVRPRVDMANAPFG